MKRFIKPTLITEEIEIDLYECMKYDQMRNNGHIRAYIPPPYHQHVYLPLTRTRQRLGWRIWFYTPCCNRRTTKLYVWGRSIACRQCVDLKYASQYRKDPDSKLEMTERKIQRLEKQKRRYWYDGRPTQFGRQYYKLRDEEKQLRHESSEAFSQKVASLRMAFL